MSGSLNRASDGQPHASVNMANSMEEMNDSAKKHRKWHVCCAVLCYILYAKFSQFLEVCQDCLFGSRNSATNSIFRTIRHVYRSVWPTREAKPHSGAALECYKVF